MRATYEAWNGQIHPWPPPADWHEAADGRWWAPDSSPNDDVDSPPESTATPDSAPVSESSPVLESEPRPSEESKPALGALPDSSAGLWQPDDEPPWWKRPTVVNTAAVTALLMAMTAAVGLFGADSDTTATDTTATDATTTSSTGQTEQSAVQPAPDPTSSSADQNQSPTDESDDQAAEATNTDATGDPSETPTTVAANSQTSQIQASNPTSTEAETQTTSTITSAVTPVDSPTSVAIDPEDKARADQLRTYFADNGLSGDLISDADLVEFANTFCVFAITADTPQQYEASRDEAITDSSSRLTQQELAVAVDGAVQIFCPEDAERLGLGS